MIIKFPKKLITPEVYEHVQDRLVKRIVMYALDSTVRKSTNLQLWCKAQMLQKDETFITYAEGIEAHAEHDITAIRCLHYVRRTITYTGDYKGFGKLELWAKLSKIVEKLKDDCEGGALVLLALCLHHGIPSNRLLIMCGAVDKPGTDKVAGHAWLAYKPTGYPLNWAFLDWCYYYDRLSIKSRNLFTIKGNTIFEYDNGKIVDSKYKTMWFGFNQDCSLKEIRYSK